MNYEDLKVYKATMDLLTKFYDYTTKIERAYRFTLCQEMKLALQDVLLEIYQANMVYDKVERISAARLSLAKFRVLYRVMKQLSLIDEKKDIQIIQSIANINTQLTAWETYSKKEKEKKEKEAEEKRLKAARGNKPQAGGYRPKAVSYNVCAKSPLFCVRL